MSDRTEQLYNLVGKCGECGREKIEIRNDKVYDTCICNDESFTKTCPDGHTCTFDKDMKEEFCMCGEKYASVQDFRKDAGYNSVAASMTQIQEIEKIIQDYAHDYRGMALPESLLNKMLLEMTTEILTYKFVE